MSSCLSIFVINDFKKTGKQKSVLMENICDENILLETLVKLSEIFYEPSGSWSRRLSPISVVLSGWESLIPPGWKLIHRMLAPSRRWYSFTYGRMDSWVSLGGKGNHTNIQISAGPWLNWTACGRKAEILQLLHPCLPARNITDNLTRQSILTSFVHRLEQYPLDSQLLCFGGIIRSLGKGRIATSKTEESYLRGSE